MRLEEAAGRRPASRDPARHAARSDAPVPTFASVSADKITEDDRGILAGLTFLKLSMCRLTVFAGGNKLDLDTDMVPRWIEKKPTPVPEQRGIPNAGDVRSCLAQASFGPGRQVVAPSAGVTPSDGGMGWHGEHAFEAASERRRERREKPVAGRDASWRAENNQRDRRVI
jgi:hypothetical protein